MPAGIANATGFTKAAAEGILKDVYLGPVNRLINQKSVFLGRLQRDRENVSGRQVIVPLHVEANERVSGSGRGGKLPDPKSQVYDKATVSTKYMYGRIKIDGPTIADLKDDMGAFLRAVESEMQAISETAARKMNEMCYGDGRGIRAQVAVDEAANATVIDVYRPWGFTGTNAALKGTKYLRKGMLVAFTDDARSGNPTVIRTGGGIQEILSVDPAGGTNGTITIGTNTMNLAAEDSIIVVPRDDTVLGVDGTSGLLGPEGEFRSLILGMGAAISSTSTYLGIAPGTRDVWKATVLANGGTLRPLDEDLIQRLVDEIETNSTGMGPTAFITSHALRRQYAALLRTDRRYQGTVEVDGGFGVKYTVVMYESTSSRIPIFVDRDCLDIDWYGIDEPRFKWYQKLDWNWMDDDGAILHRLPDDDAFQATLRLYTELATGSRNCHGKLTDLQT